MSNEFDTDKEELPLAQVTTEEVRRILRQRELNSIESPPGAAPRNTYKSSHATKLRKYFVEACDSRKDVCIPYTEFNCKAKRMHAIICDSLLWLIHNDNDGAVKWAAFKTQIGFRISPDAAEGIWIEWRKSGEGRGRCVQTALPGFTKPSEQTAEYMDKIIAWIEGDREGMLRIEGLNLSLERQQSAIKMFESAGVTQYKVEPNRIIAI